MNEGHLACSRVTDLTRPIGAPVLKSLHLLELRRRFAGTSDGKKYVPSDLLRAWDFEVKGDW
jgi:hypothetical protein